MKPLEQLSQGVTFRSGITVFSAMTRPPELISATLLPEIVMHAGETVDAAVVDLDGGEKVFIPSPPDFAGWDAYEAARQSMILKLSCNSPAPRYGAVAANVVGA
jgi:hypothetical protein